MAMTTFKGLRTTPDFTVTGMRPENYREGILMLNPRGDTLITALTTMMPNKQTTDPTFHWYTNRVVRQGGGFTAGELYTDVALASAYTSGGVAGDVVHIKVLTSITQYFRVGHVVTLRISAYNVDTIGRVMAIQAISSTVSRVAVKLLEADDNGSAVSKDLSDADTILVAGNSNAEGSGLPASVVTEPSHFSSYTQIFKTPLEISRTAMQTTLRTGSEYARLKTEALTYHGVELEKAFWWSVPSKTTGTNGKEERTTAGIKYWITTEASTNVSDYRYDASYSGKTWAENGWDWLEDKLQTIQTYQAGPALLVCGPGALSGINKLARSTGTVNIQPSTTSYGLKVNRWISPFGEFDLKLHPLFNLETTESNSIYVLRPEHLQYVYVQDTKFLPDMTWEQGGTANQDGKVEAYLTECGLELHHPETFGYLTGVGLDNDLA